MSDETRVLPASAASEAFRSAKDKPTILTFANADTWLESRTKGYCPPLPKPCWLGASDMSCRHKLPVVQKQTAAVLAQEARDLVLCKAGLLPGRDKTLAMAMGDYLEPFIVRHYILENPHRSAEMVAGKIVFVHPSGLISATVDAWCWDLDRPEIRWPLQLKYKGYPIKEVPDYIKIQCMAEALCVGSNQCSTAILCARADSLICADFPAWTEEEAAGYLADAAEFAAEVEAARQDNS